MKLSMVRHRAFLECDCRHPSQEYTKPDKAAAFMCDIPTCSKGGS